MATSPISSISRPTRRRLKMAKAFFKTSRSRSTRRRSSSHWRTRLSRVAAAAPFWRSSLAFQRYNRLTLLRPRFSGHRFRAVAVEQHLDGLALQLVVIHATTTTLPATRIGGHRLELAVIAHSFAAQFSSKTKHLECPAIRRHLHPHPPLRKRGKEIHFPQGSPNVLLLDIPLSGTTYQRHRYFEPSGNVTLPNNLKHSDCP